MRKTSLHIEIENFYLNQGIDIYRSQSNGHGNKYYVASDLEEEFIIAMLNLDGTINHYRLKGCSTNFSEEEMLRMIKLKSFL